MRKCHVRPGGYGWMAGQISWGVPPRYIYSSHKQEVLRLSAEVHSEAVTFLSNGANPDLLSTQIKAIELSESRIGLLFPEEES